MTATWPATGTTPADGSVTNAKVAVGAAIDLAKLATNPLARANHTGSQAAATISDLPETVDDQVAALLQQGANVTLTYDDTAGTLTIAVSGITEAAQDAIGAALTDSSTIDFTYDDGTNAFTAVVKATSISNSHIASGAAIALSKLATDPLARANHTGTQLAATVSDLTETVQDLLGAMATDSATVNFTYDDSAGTLTAVVQGLTSASVSDFTEATQDAVGAMATDSATVNFTYDDTAGTLTAVVQGLTSASISDFAEAVDDRVNALLVQGSGVTLTYDDTANTLTISASGSGYSDEQAQDAVGSALTDSATIDLTYDDGANTITAIIVAGSITDSHVASANKDGAAGTASMRTLGTGAAQAAAGNDSRLSDQRVPTDGSVTGAKVNTALKPSGSAASTDESLRRLGSGATHAAAGDDSRFPSTGEKNALAGTSGTPGTGNEYVTTQDTRNADTREPTAPADSLLTACVDYVNGNDSNHGRSWYRPYKTIQAANNALKTIAEATYIPSSNWLGIGRIYLAPGDHDVGTGVLIDGFRPVEIYGTASGYLNHTRANSASRIFSSSSSATELIRVSHTSPSDGISRGFRCRDVAFVPSTTVNTSLTKCIYLRAAIEAEVSGCGFDVADGTTTSTITAIHHEQLTGAGDNMGLRLYENFSSRMQFYKAAAAGGGTNFNRIIIRGNRCGYEHATIPTIHLEGDFRASWVGPNQLQGAATQIKVDSTNADGNVFAHNAGESNSSVVNPFIDFADGKNITGCTIIGGDVTTGAGVNKTVTDATNASPIVATTSVAHGFNTGDVVTLSGVLGNTAANGSWNITVLSTTTFALTTNVSTGVISTGNGAWSSGGSQVAYPHGVYLRFGTGCKGNTYIGGGSANGVASSGLKDRVVDNSTAYKNRILSGEYGLPLLIAAGATVSDADFRTPPPNGTLALASDGAVWKKASNVWASMTAAAGGNAAWARVGATYGTTVTPNVTGKSVVVVDVTDTVAFTIAAPTGMVDGQGVTFVLVNSSGGTMGNVTWNAAFYKKWNNTLHKPANNGRTAVSFVYHSGLSVWLQAAPIAANISASEEPDAPHALPGATAATRYAGATTSGAPASGTFVVGDFVVAQDGKVWVCTVAGSPGTWADVGSGGGSYTDEQAQDAVGTILADSSTLDFTYTDATPEITGGVKATSIDNSHVAAGAGIEKSKLGSLVIVNADVDVAAAIAESKLNLASDAAAGTASRRTLGISSTSAAAGNDSRLLLPPFAPPSGAIAETYARNTPSIATVATTSGSLVLAAIQLPKGVTITSISWLIGTTALGTGTHAWFSLYDASLNLLRQSTDDTSPVMAASQPKTYNLSSTYDVTTSGTYYIGFLANASTMPTIWGISASTGTLTALPPMSCGTSTTGLNTGTAPNPAGALSAKNTLYGYVS